MLAVILSELISYPILSDIYPRITPTINPTRLTIKNAFKFAATSDSADAPNNTNEPSPSVVIKAANKPPKESFLFLYIDATIIVPPHPGITPNNPPIIG